MELRTYMTRITSILHCVISGCINAVIIWYFQDPKRHLEEKVDFVMTSNIVQCLGAMLDSISF